MVSKSGFARWAIGKPMFTKGYIKVIAEYQKTIPPSGESPDEPAIVGYANGLSGKIQKAQQISKKPS
jgi:hypothetical protein